MKNLEFNSANSYDKPSNIICENILQTIEFADQMSENLHELKQMTGAYIDGYLDVFIGTFMAGENKAFKLTSKYPEEPTIMRFRDDEYKYKLYLSEQSPLYADTINITLEKNKTGLYDSIITLRNTIDSETEMIVEINSKDFKYNFYLDFSEKY